MNLYSEKNRRLKVILGFIVFAAMIIFGASMIGYFLFLKSKGEMAIRPIFLSAETGLTSVFLNSLVFNAEATSKAIAIAVGIYAYFGVVAFLFSMIMVFSKHAYHHAINVLTVLIAFGFSAYYLGGALTYKGSIYEAHFVPMVILAIAFGVFGIIAMVFAMVFPLQVGAEEMVDPAPERIAKSEVIVAPSMSEPVSQEEDENEEKPAKPLRKTTKIKKIGPKAEPEQQMAPTPAEDTSIKVVGKYEVFPEAGFYKYRLKANNGEILIVSSGYKAKASAIAGIETLKKNMPTASTRIVTDKNGYAQFRISSANDSRLIATGEIYPNASGANSALASVMKFYESDKVVVLDELPESEIREWEIELPEAELSANGKIEIIKEDDKYIGKLYANNGEILMVTATYSSRKALMNAIENLREKALSARITIARDKQNRYQYRVFSDNGMILVVGETYPSKDGAISSANSMRRFLPKAKIAN